jgi:hypothetical protein
MLLAAWALAASFLGRARSGTRAAGRRPRRVAFVVSIAASVFVLISRSNHFVFVISGPKYLRGALRVLTGPCRGLPAAGHDLDRFWIENDARLRPLFNAYRRPNSSKSICTTRHRGT